MKVLVTGGAGYIGSHTCVELLNAGHELVIVDNFVNSKPEALDAIRTITGKDFAFYEVDIRDRAALDVPFAEHKIDAVIHFAGLKAVGESVEKPLEYYDNNLYGFIVLAEVMRAHGVKQFVFSSSATVYGMNNPVPFNETMPTSATNPYGYTKVMIEQILHDYANADPEFSVVALRYFKVVFTPVQSIGVVIKDGFEGTTISCGEALDFSNVTGLTTYIATGKVGTTKVYITTQEVNDVVPANTGLLVKGAPGTYLVPVAETPEESDAFGPNLLEPALEGYAPTQEDIDAKTIYRYGKTASGCGFQLVTKESQTVSPGKAYLRLTEEMAAAAAEMGIAFEGGVVDAIEGIAADTQDANAPMYNLAGQRVNGSYRGVVIQDGKKVRK